MNKEYIEKLLKEQREICAEWTDNIQSIRDKVLNAPSPSIDLSGVTKEETWQDDIIKILQENCFYSGQTRGFVVHGAIEKICDYFRNIIAAQAGVSKPVWVKAEDVVCSSDAWSLREVLNKLIEASEILLDKKNYDGHGWEEIHHAKHKAKLIISRLDESVAPEPVEELLKECRDLLLMCTLLDKSGQCKELVDKIDKRHD